MPHRALSPAIITIFIYVIVVNGEIYFMPTGRQVPHPYRWHYAALQSATAEPRTTTMAMTEQSMGHRMIRPTILPPTTPMDGSMYGMHGQISTQCGKLPTYRLRMVCRKVARSFNDMDRNNATRGFANHDQAVQWYRSSRTTAARLLQTNRLPRFGDQPCNIRCPTGAEWDYYTSDNMKSLSPWKYCLHFDPNRIPQWMSKAMCLCNGCINPITKREDLSYASMSLKTTTTVLRKDNSVASFDKCNNKACYESLESVVVGCHCRVPNTFG